MHMTVNFLGLFFRTGKIFFGLTRSSCLSVRMTDNFSANFGKSAPTHDILTSLHIFWLEMGGGVQNTMGVQYTMDVNWPRVQFTMGFKIPYDTGFNLPWGSKYHMTPGWPFCKYWLDACDVKNKHITRDDLHIIINKNVSIW
jgi:hypothetical protein